MMRKKEKESQPKPDQRAAKVRLAKGSKVYERSFTVTRLLGKVVRLVIVAGGWGRCIIKMGTSLH
ncbi:hypothetical protein ZHAS_00021202 [Anopheles sinensis]|uniref:Uncharacterized protein n=1 Tax=Anopheles sinensis TaxID=74873 RepID=A0A084WRS5_ANOSI|nr:hypothetical protein ZHAS_00021202 [Anopheles sinensis]